MGAEGNVFELVENAKYNGSRPESGKNIAAHKGVTYWDYFIKTVQIDNTVFDLVANVRKRTDGPFVYSIQLNENKNVEAAPLPDSHEVALNRMPTASSSDSVNQNDSSVNSEYMQNQTNNSEKTQLGNPDNLSLAEYEALYKDAIKGQLVKDKYVMNAAESIEYNELMQENSALQEAVATLQNELKASGNDVRLEDVKKAVKGLVKEYGGDMKLADEYAVQVSTVFNYIANTENIGNQDVFQYIHKVAESIIKNSSSVDDTLQIENADILDTLKSTKIQVSEAVKNGMGKELYNGLRRSHMKTLKLLNNEGVPVDSFYRELNELYPWAFPDTAVNPSDQLQAIADFVDSCEPRVINPYVEDGSLTAATEQLALDIYEKYFEVRSVRETFADKAVKKQAKMKAEYAKKIAQTKEKTRESEQKKQAKIKERYEERLSKLDAKRREQLDKLNDPPKMVYRSTGQAVRWESCIRRT